MSIWERFNNIASSDEVNNAKNEFTPLAEGKYVVTLEEVKPAETQSGFPKIEFKFRTLENRIIFFNQLLQTTNPDMTAKNIANAVVILGKLANEEIHFTNMSDLESKIYGIPLNVNQYDIELSYRYSGDKAYPQVKVIGLHTDGGTTSSDGFMNLPNGLEDELPFN